MHDSIAGSWAIRLLALKNYKMKKISQTTQELRKHVDEQLILLNKACSDFDGGMEIAAKSISIILRLLLRTTRNQKALLDHFGLNSWKIISTNSFRSLPSNAMTFNTSGILALSISDQTRLMPKLDFSEYDSPKNWIDFSVWWEKDIVHQLRPGNAFANPEKHPSMTFTRKAIVTYVADTDGGAHVDTELAEEYHEFSRKPSMGAFIVANNNLEMPLSNNVHLPSVRQFAAEFIYSIGKITIA